MLNSNKDIFKSDGIDGSVFIHVNNFDYESLLDKMVAKLDLRDTHITSEIVLKTFKTLAEKFNNNRRGELTPEELEVVEVFMVCFSGMRFSDYEGEPATEFYDSIGEILNNAYEGFGESLTTDVGDLSDEAKEFNEALYKLIDSIDGDLAIEMLIDLVDKYLSDNFNELELAIMKEMEQLLTGKEIIAGIEVVEKAGKVVKYGDSLITFPIILMKATES